jgi:hypothetical protein
MRPIDVIEAEIKALEKHLRDHRRKGGFLSSFW